MLKTDKTKLAVLRQQYVEFSEAAGLPEQWERTRMELMDDSAIMKAPQSSLTQEAEIFDPEIARNSLLERLENSPGLADNIATLQYYARSTEFVETREMQAAISCD